MASLNVTGICRLTRDAEVRPTSNGTWYTIGVSAFRKNPKPGKQEVDFFDADLYQKEPTKEFEAGLKKGRLLFIEHAYLRNDKFINAEGIEKNRMKIQITAFEMMNDKSNSTPTPEEVLASIEGPTDPVVKPKVVVAKPLEKIVPVKIDLEPKKEEPLELYDGEFPPKWD